MQSSAPTPPPSMGQRALKWGGEVVIAGSVGVWAGAAAAFFLWALETVTRVRFQFPGLVWALPVGGVAVVALYRRWGGRAGQGNSLIIEEIHQPGGGVPRRMAPLVLAGTLLTHLVGGAAGREGTAVQMGGSLAAAWARLCNWQGAQLRMALLAGVAGGFGAVFGTPVAGALFAVEVLVRGRLDLRPLVPLLVAAWVGHLTAQACGAQHSHYAVAAPDLHTWAAGAVTLGQAATLGLAAGAVAWLFVHTEHTLRHAAGRWIRPWWGAPVLGGVALLALCAALGTRDYLGLSVLAEHAGSITLGTCFEAGGATPWSWLAKLLFTAITLASGFKGGEVTPLFFMGAALGNAVGMALGWPVDLCAALGFLAVFAAAAKTPLACTVMGAELFGPTLVLPAALACFVAVRGSGARGLYAAQRAA